MLDLRIPAGYFFILMGAALLLTGLTADFRAPLLDINLNLYFGIFSVAFGGVFLLLARRARS
jgi:ABC-type enterobactin transport system permease subunit